MELRNAILACVGQAPGKITRTVAQKILYLAALKGLVEAEYEPHYYGPYSSEVAGMLEDLTSSGLIDETIETLRPSAGEGPWEIRRYRYSLPEDVSRGLDAVITGEERAEAEELEKVIDLCNARSALNPRALSIATKVLFVLDETDESLTDAQIARKARELGWKVTEAEIKDSVLALLEDLGFVETEA